MTAPTTSQANDAQSTADALAAALSATYAGGAVAQRFDAGSVPVYALGDRIVLKLFPLREREHFDTECRVLDFLHDKLPIATPELLSHGEAGEWLWVLMSRIAGRPLAEVWDALDTAARERVMQRVGEAMAVLHALPVATLELPGTPWQPFIADRHAHCVARQHEHGLASPWLERIAHWLAAHPVPEADRLALLHTEVMREHVFVAWQNDAWQVTGLVDFEPATIGAPEYEFASVAVFLTAGDAQAFAAVLHGYGLRADRAWRERAFTYLLLHRYSKLRWYLDRLDVGDDTPLEALVDAWFGAA